MDEQMTMKINWVKCADRMPPDDENLIILNDTGYFIIREGYLVNRWESTLSVNGSEWCQYTEEAWMEVNK